MGDRVLAKSKKGDNEATCGSRKADWVSGRGGGSKMDTSVSMDEARASRAGVRGARAARARLAG